MENSSLRKAHEAGRQAVKFQRKGLYEQAAERHLLAANLLYELQQRIPKESLALCSLEEQNRYHKRQAELAQFLRGISDKVKTKLATMADKSNQRNPHPQTYQMNRVLSQIAHNEVQILKNFDEADSLLQILSENENPKSPIGGKSSHVQKPLEFTIRPRKDSEVIEELQTVNLNLRTLVDNLLKQLQECREENKQLRAKLEKYEQTEKKPDITTSAIHLSYDDLPVRELPELAPLEEPIFDFSAYL